jgi:leucyl/phenylalanyl-tRNA--protein transferase
MKYVEGIAILEAGEDFPDPAYGPKNYPVAIGYDLTPDLMLNGYERGLFAWSSDPATWWSPDPRAIIRHDGFHVSRSLAAKIRKKTFRVTMDHGFEEVIRNCALPRRPGDEIWISEDFISAFTELFNLGRAHSVECWKDGHLAGGVFGVAINGFFSAESMFHKQTDASKIALFHLVELLRESGFSLLDIQVLTDHTRSLGAEEISRARYLARLKQALKADPAPLGKRVIVDSDS